MEARFLQEQNITRLAMPLAQFANQWMDTMAAVELPSQIAINLGAVYASYSGATAN
jgi:hypothetical protein